MGLLKPTANNTAYAKIGIMGFAGSGKTFTAADISIGLTKQAKATHAAFFDSEKGSDFVAPKFKKNGIELLVHRGRAFRDLLTVMREAEEAGIPVLIIDSISHVWRDLCDSYAKKYNKRSLTMYDWGILKGQWKEYTDLFINSKLHILMLGRAGYEYDQTTNADTGKAEIIKTGTKMKVEGETGFEPDLLLEMDRVHTDDKIINRCWVIKDRSDTLNGKAIDYPKYESFGSFFGFLNIGGSHVGVDTTRNSEAMFDDPDWSQVEIQKRREIALDEIQAALIKAGMDGTSTEAKKNRVAQLESVFKTASKTAIENLKIRELEAGLDQLKINLGQKEAPKQSEEKDVL
jgi:hypothetical protein